MISGCFYRVPNIGSKFHRPIAENIHIQPLHFAGVSNLGLLMLERGNERKKVIIVLYEKKIFRR